MHCPHCHEESFARKKIKTDGWKVVGEVEVCALCGAELGKNDNAKERVSKNDDRGKVSKERLAALLGGDFSEKTVLAGESDRRFCRNCRHFIVHPFKNICALSDLEADPMGECAGFEERRQDQ